MTMGACMYKIWQNNQTQKQKQKTHTVGTVSQSKDKMVEKGRIDTLKTYILIT